MLFICVFLNIFVSKFDGFCFIFRNKSKIEYSIFSNSTESFKNRSIKNTKICVTFVEMPVFQGFREFCQPWFCELKIQKLLDLPSLWKIQNKYINVYITLFYYTNLLKIVTGSGRNQKHLPYFKEKKWTFIQGMFYGT